MNDDPVVYSHGGTGADGKVNGAGYPVDVSGATGAVGLDITIDQGSATVQLQHHRGPLDADGDLEERDWVDDSNGGWSLTPGAGNLGKKFRADLAPYWRTVVSGIAGGGEVRSKFSRVISDGTLARPLPRNPGHFFSTPYDR